MSLSNRRRLPIVNAARDASIHRHLVYSEFEIAMERELDKTGVVTSCRKGCNHCCKFPLTISLLEGLQMYQWLSDHRLYTPALKTTLTATHEKVFGLSPPVWMMALIPCPLLNAKGLCSAYQVRPFVCRSMFSTYDPEFCEGHRFSGGKGLVDRTEHTAKFKAAEDQILRNIRLTDMRVPIPTAILLAERIVREDLPPDGVNRTLFEDWVKHC